MRTVTTTPNAKPSTPIDAAANLAPKSPLYPLRILRGSMATMASTFKLHNYWRSSASYRVRMALALKGIEYSYVPVSIISGEQQSPAYQALAPIGHVPCLEIDGEPFVESVAIIELLDGLYPEPALFPADPRAKAHVRALVETVNSGIQPLQNLVVLGRLPETERREWAQHFIGRGLAAFEALLARPKATRPGPYCTGADICAADLFLVPQMYAARRFEVNLEATPKCVAIDEALRALPWVQRSAPEVQLDAPK
jgi:maleylacetoacetate isomerase